MRTSVWKSAAVLALILVGSAPGLHAQPVLFPEPLSPRIANYRIDVSLEPEQRLLRGREILSFRSSSADRIRELRFHLYLNAFRNSKSTFLKDADKKTIKELDKGGWAFIQIDRISVDSGPDLSSSLEFIHPDDDNENDRTVARLVLPRPLGPGETIVLNLDFQAKLPEPPVARSGSKGEYFFVAQWFPKIGVYEEGGWNCHQYHAHTEFFADFGVYDVRITLPEEYVVGATGVEVSRTIEGGGLATHYYHAEDVHDFAWAASPGFVEFRGRAQDVDLRVLMHREHSSQGERHLAAAQLAVEYYQNWYGDYPYPNLTVIDPCRGAGESGGMEYPTLITAGTIRGLPEGVRAVESVIIHEFGHNFFYHLVATNEFEESWLDEGITTYSEIQIMHDIYGPGASFVDLGALKVDNMQVRRYSYLVAPDFDPTIKNAWEYYNGLSYRANSYSKPALALITLENYLGTETMRAILRAYVARYRFKHPHTQDFVAVASEVAGQDLGWFFDPLLYTNAVLDYSVDHVSTAEVEPGKGYDFTLSVGEGAESRPRPDDEKAPEVFESVVKVRRLGQFQFPVELEVEFEDGEIVRESWDGRDLWKEYRYFRPARLKSATVDPEKKVALDVDLGNNAKTVAKEKKKGMFANQYVDMLWFAIRSPR